MTAAQSLGPVFLTAEWRDLAMLNYEIDPAVLEPRVPAGTELDAWSGRSYGREFAGALRDRPSSAFLADGSPVVVRRGRRL